MGQEVIELPGSNKGNGKNLNPGRTCSAINTRGEPCSGWAMRKSSYCWVHNPNVSQQRYAAQKKGGATNQVKHNPKTNVGHVPTEIRSIDDLLALLDYTLAEFLMLSNGLNRNKALIQLITAYSAVLKDSGMENRLDELNDEIQDLLKKANKIKRKV